MALSVKDLKKEREWRASTGMPKTKFEALLPYFKSAYVEILGVDIKEAQENLHQQFALPNYEEFLFFVLFTLKNPTTFDVNGLVFGISQAGTIVNFRRGLKILKRAFEICHQLPENEFSTEEEAIVFLNKQKRLKIDVTEIAVQRPKNVDSQKEHYSGKKKKQPKIINHQKWEK